MYKFVALLLVLFINKCWNHDFSPKTLTLNEFNNFMIDYIDEHFNKQREENDLRPIQRNPFLMDIAKEEAGRLALLNSLELPKLNITESYQGYSYRYYRKKNLNTFQIASNRICYENILQEFSDLNTTKVKEDCNMNLIKTELYSEVGYGCQLNKNGDLFAVVIFLSVQPKQYPSTTVATPTTSTPSSEPTAKSSFSLPINRTSLDLGSFINMIPTIQQNIEGLTDLVKEVYSLIKTNKTTTN